jgi:hypothetical protein
MVVVVRAVIGFVLAARSGELLGERGGPLGPREETGFRQFDGKR